jgi:hypothetical protein
MKACNITIVGLLGLALFAQTAAARDPWEGQPVYGHEMMTRAEIDTYRNTMKAFETRDEKVTFWLAEVERMQQRALEWGVGLPDPPKLRDPDQEREVRMDKEPYFIDIMTDEEIEHYYARLREMEWGPERRAFKADHIMRMRARGFARGASVPGTHDWNYVFEKGVRRPDVIP